METIEAPVRDSEAEMEADLARLMALVNAYRITEARSLAPELAAKWPDSHRIQHMARVLEPPKVIPSRGVRNVSSHREIAWLKAHAHEHPGCWLAVFEDRLIAEAPDRKSVVAAAREALGDRPALLFYQPPDPE